jgi:hypothetical protein
VTLYRLSKFRFLHKNMTGSALFPLARGENHCESYDDASRAIKVGTMAVNHAQPAGHPVMDYAKHEKTYLLFLQLIKYAVAGAALVLALRARFCG